MSKLFVIADDLTGALDTAVQFCKQSISTSLLPDEHCPLTARVLESTVLVMNLSTRHLSAREAYDKVLFASRLALSQGVPFLYKKTDSVLRGNVGAELTALLDASGEKRLDFVPAYPALGRTTLGGVQRLNGQPIHESLFKNDPFEPITESFVPAVVARQSALPCEVVTSGEMPQVRDDRHICVFDADSDEALQQAVQCAHKSSGLRAMAGCAGLAGVLGEVLALPKTPCSSFSPYQKLFVVCGSVSPIAGRQLTYAQTRGFFRLTLPKHQRLSCDAVQDDLIAGLMAACQTEKPVILDVFDDENPSLIPAQREQIAKNLGILVQNLWEKGMRATIMVTGGDTLQAVLKALHCNGIFPIREMQPGVVLSACLCGEQRIPVISKAGSFGTESLLTETARALERH